MTYAPNANKQTAQADLRTSIDNFEVEFSVGTVAEEVGLEENIDQRDTLLKEYSDECRAELERLTCNADNLDLLSSVCCGIVSGMRSSCAIRGNKLSCAARPAERRQGTPAQLGVYMVR